jgi:hypothetical protein
MRKPALNDRLERVDSRPAFYALVEKGLPVVNAQSVPLRCPMTTLPTPVSGKPCPYDPRLLGGGAVMPYIGSWTGEQRCALRLAWRGTLNGGVRIGYADETPFDRDQEGVLWQRYTARVGAGRPLYTVVHPARQRRVMSRLLCQVCAQAADHTEAGTLWLLPAREVAAFDGQDGLVTQHPPLCVPCARISVRVCPGMRPGYVAIRAHSVVCGVIGTIYRPLDHSPWMEIDADDTGDVVMFDHPSIAWTQAHQLTRMLINIRVVNLGTES